MKKNIRFYLVLIILVAAFGLVVPMSVFAQSSSPISAGVDRNTFTTDDYLTLSVTVDESVPAGQPQLPALDGFELISSGSSTQISIINGDMQVSTVYQYTLRPLTTGTMEIGPVTVSTGSQQFSTAPITVTVTQGNGNPTQSPSQPGFPGLPGFPNFPALPGFPSLPTLPPTSGGNQVQGGQLDPADIPPALNGQDFFVEARVDNTTPYQGEQVIYTFRFFQAAEIYEQPEYQEPVFSKLWHERVEGQIEYSAEAGGRNYRVTELTTVLFPTVTGEIIIEPAALVIPGGFFSQGGSFETDPVVLQVQRLPEPVPAGFNGAVGSFHLTAQIDPNATAVNETVSWNVALAGAGNIGNIADPDWPDLQEWRAFDSPAGVEAAFVDGKWQGARRYERVLVPTQSGNLEIPSLAYVYFNPDTRSYETTQSAPLPVSVAPGTAGSGSTISGTSSTNSLASAGSPDNLDSGLRPLKDTAAQEVAAAPLTGNPLFWFAWLVPVMLVTGHVSWQKWQNHQKGTAAERYKAGATGRALTAIAQAKKHQTNSAEHILPAFLSERLNEQMAGRTHQAIINRLEMAGVEKELCDRVQELLAQGEISRYAPENSRDRNAYLDEMVIVITALDRIL